MCINALSDDVLKERIASTLSDYRHVPRNGMNVGHVSRWINQFPTDDRRFVLEETERILSMGYFRRQDYDRFIIEMAGDEENEVVFENAAFLDIQENGLSQHELIDSLRSEYTGDINIVTRRSSGSWVRGFERFVYFDDVCFSGLKASEDIAWLIEHFNLRNVEIILYFMGNHTSAAWQIKQKIDRDFPGRRITIYVSGGELKSVENRLTYNASSKVFWPTEQNAIIPPSVRNPANYTGTCRNGFIASDLFPDEQRRNRLESILTAIGFEILSYSAEPSNSLKPLGFYPFRGLGFGGTMFTYRNCPNNVPLAFWWGNYEQTGGPALACWYPLMKRIVYTR